MNPIQKLIDYVRSAKAEALKVSWPSKQETIRYASLVIGVSIGLAVTFSAIDFGFTKLFNATLLEKVARDRAAEQQAATPQEPTTPAPVTPTLDIDAQTDAGTVTPVK